MNIKKISFRNPQQCSGNKSVSKIKICINKFSKTVIQGRHYIVDFASHELPYRT